MSDSNVICGNTESPTVYVIRIKGYLDNHWSDWFEGMKVEAEDCGETVLTGSVIDQPALHGILKKIRDLGMPLLSINRLVNNQDACEKNALCHSDTLSKNENSR